MQKKQLDWSINLEADEYLYPALEERYGDSISIRYVAQCGCGGHVIKVTILK